MNTSKRTPSYKLTAFLLLAALCIVGTAGALIARYVRSSEQSDSGVSGSFYFSGDLLQAGAPSTYDVTDWKTNGITFELRNWSTENPALISATDISYKIVLPTGWDVKTVVDGASQNQTPIDGCYVLKANSNGTAAHHTVNIIYTGGGNPDATITVTVKALSPFATTLTADFRPLGASLPDYTVTDCGTYLLAVLQSNAYDGNFNLSWNPAAVSPDNSNPHMKDWVDISNATLDMQSNTRYELIFFKNANQSYSPTTGSGTSLQIGGTP